MKHKPGYSWGPDKPVNLIEFNGRWYAIYYHPDGFSELIKDFGPVLSYWPSEMSKLLHGWNYNTDRLCPVVKLEMDMTA